MRTTDTKSKMLKEGRSLLQRHGYNGFSFQDIADVLQLKKPSLYDHFASKEDLVIAILSDYSQMFDSWSGSIKSKPPLEQIRRVFDVFYSFTSDKKKICPVLALAADPQPLSKKVQAAMKEFLDKWLGWLEARITEGQKSSAIRKDLDPKALSFFIYNLGMGSQFQARMQNDPSQTLTSGDMVVKFIRNV